jgi:hypothetical protein
MEICADSLSHSPNLFQVYPLVGLCFLRPLPLCHPQVSLVSLHVSDGAANAHQSSTIRSGGNVLHDEERAPLVSGSS